MNRGDIMKPKRKFNADEGDYSVGTAGPDALEEDIDQLMTMFNPEILHKNGEEGGIKAENLNKDLLRRLRNIYEGTSVPTNDLGEDGDIYLQYKK